MFDLDTIRAINNRATTPSAVQSRDCSVCFSRGGAVIHSARHRDTVFIYGTARGTIARLRALSAADIKKDSPTLGSIIAKRQQPALNRYIETLYSRYSA